MLSYVANHSKQRKTTKVIKLQWIASIWCQKHQTNAKLQKWSYFDELHRFDVKTIKTFELGRKTFKTTQNYKRNQITMNCIDLTSERSKMLRYVAKLQKWSYYDEFASIWRQNDQNNAKLQTRLNYDEFASIWHENYQKCWGTSKNIQNKAKLRKWSNYNELHRFDVKTFKTFGRKNTKVIKLQWIASIWFQKHQNNAKLRKWSNYNALHRFDVKAI